MESLEQLPNMFGQFFIYIIFAFQIALDARSLESVEEDVF